MKFLLKDHLLNVLKLKELHFFFLEPEAIMIAVDYQKSFMCYMAVNEHVGHQYCVMHFGNDTRWQMRDATQHFSFFI